MTPGGLAQILSCPMEEHEREKEKGGKEGAQTRPGAWVTTAFVTS